MTSMTRKHAHLLRQAADRLDARVKSGSSRYDNEWQALVAWLRKSADWHTPSPVREAALAVARAILGGAA